ncbi:hypothetical protein [Amycolatopsis sp. 195334CR]|uniref:hypothetical protein n=1 Tax=Amycolatopsis sp. 195334CR TaxID=2814588 RepID=UPI001A8F77C8|nr:hypothetical protein [Amycolatopsis sp. 195334CR]MBN6034440.1 hypothetical protein [Amycolatopsis sp. 195334CR]
MDTTITQQEANRRVDEHLAAALRQFPPGAELHERQRFEADPCDDPDDQGPPGRVIASRSTEVLGIEPARIPEYYDTMKAWWEANGFRVLDNEPPHEFLWVENREDAVRLTLEASAGHLYLLASSPCVWPSGRPT